MSVYRVSSSKSSDSIFPKVRPTLDLDFANSKTLDPRITFTRSSGGSYVGADGLIKYAGVNEARFDHNPVTGESLGLLIEEPRANLLPYSELFNAAPWIAGNLSAASTTATAAPTGTNTAIRITENTAASAFHFLSAILTKAASAIQYTFSVYGKAGERELAFSMANGTTGAVARFNLATGVITQAAIAYGGGFTAQGATMTSAGNGWYRCTLTFTTDATTGLTAQISLYNTTLATNVYAGNGNSGLFIWGAQLEAGAFPTSYIPTQASAVTRAADNASITGTNFSSWYNQSEGTVSISCITRRTLNTGNATDFLISNSFTTTYTSRIIGWFNNGPAPYISVFVNNINIFLSYIGVPPGSSSNIPIKKAIALATRNMRVATNGTIITGNLGNTTVPNYLPNDFNRLLLGYEGIFAGYLNGTISRFTYYPKALSNSQLQALTR
jgi:hypothetical protein